MSKLEPDLASSIPSLRIKPSINVSRSTIKKRESAFKRNMIKTGSHLGMYPLLQLGPRSPVVFKRASPGLKVATSAEA